MEPEAVRAPEPAARLWSVSTVNCFLTDGADDLVPVLFVEAGLGFVTAATLPLSASFYLVSVFSASSFSASFSSLARHSAI